MSWLTWLFVLILLGAGIAAAFLAYRAYMFGDTGINFGGLLFKQRPEPRLGVIEQAPVDSRRRLVLVRRDDVEHLIGGQGEPAAAVFDRYRVAGAL